MSNTGYSKINLYLDEIRELQKEALKDIEKCLKETLAGRDMACDLRCGSNRTNDYRNYVWLSVTVDDVEYWINAFYNDVDKQTGNIHTQFGRIQFCRNLVANRPEKTKSPNRFAPDGKHFMFCPENTYNPNIRLYDEDYSTEKVVEVFLLFIDKKK